MDDTFALAGTLTDVESSPSVDIDPATGDVAVALLVVPEFKVAAQIGIVWLDPDPLAADHIVRPLYLFPEGPLPLVNPRLAISHNQNHLLVGYSARLGVADPYEHDAYLLAGSRWAVALPVMWRDFTP